MNQPIRDYELWAFTVGGAFDLELWWEWRYRP